jgi:hypothetical protein
MTKSSKSGRYVSKTKDGTRRSGDAPATSDEALPEFIGSFDSGQPDLVERSEEILRAHFPDR